jgi:hypothetical protein
VILPENPAAEPERQKYLALLRKILSYV